MLKILNKTFSKLNMGPAATQVIAHEEVRKAMVGAWSVEKGERRWPIAHRNRSNRENRAVAKELHRKHGIISLALAMGYVALAFPAYDFPVIGTAFATYQGRCGFIGCVGANRRGSAQRFGKGLWERCLVPTVGLLLCADGTASASFERVRFSVPRICPPPATWAGREVLYDGPQILHSDRVSSGCRGRRG